MAAPASPRSRGHVEVVHTRVQFHLSTMPCTFLSLLKMYNFVNGNRNSRNSSEGKEELKSRQILAVGCTMKTGKTREISEILKSMRNTMECERDNCSDLGGAKRPTENVFHMLVIVLSFKRMTLFPHTITGSLKLIIIIMN